MLFFPYLNPRSYLKTDRTKMVVLREFEVSVKIESISFQTKVEHVDLRLAITKHFFKNSNFEAYAEKK